MPMLFIVMVIVGALVVPSPAHAQATTLLEPHYCERVVTRGRGVEEAFSQLLLIINQLHQQQTQLKHEVLAMRDQMSRMNSSFTSEFSTVTTDVATLSSDVRSFNSDVITQMTSMRADFDALDEDISSDIDSIKSESGSITSRLDSLSSGILSLGLDMTSLKSDVSSLKSGVESLNSNGLRVRNDNITSTVRRAVEETLTDTGCLGASASGPREVWTPGQELASDSPVADGQEEYRFRDCDDVWAAGRRISGVYTLRPVNATHGFQAYCELGEEDPGEAGGEEPRKAGGGGGWTRIQYRDSGDTDFYRNWTEYKLGFGDPSGEHWLGNEHIHKLTAQAVYMLAIDMWDWRFDSPGSAADGTLYRAEAETFYVDTERRNYRLHLPRDYYAYSGRGASGLRVHAGSFSTYDRNNLYGQDNCAETFHCGWWFTSCVINANLNGRYYEGGYATPETRQRARDDLHWPNINQSLRKTVMKIKRVNSREPQN